MSFKNLEQRMAQTYLDTFPEFKSAGEGCGLKEQQVFYNLLQNLYRLAFELPELFVPRLHEDDVYINRFSKVSENKPDLQTNMKMFTGSVDGLLEVMFRMGKSGESVKLNNRQKVILQKLGIGDGKTLPAAWTWMSARPGANLLAFSRCLFDNDHSYVSGVYARLLGDKAAFLRLENWLKEHGYQRYQYLDGRMSMTYANPVWDKSPPAAGNQFKIKHTGVSFSYDLWFNKPAVAGLCIPGGLKPYLEIFQDMDEKLQRFVASSTKQCDGCNFCIQTDKTGKRPRAFFTLKYNSKTLNLCPLFPGYSYCWTSLYENTVDDITAMLDFMDRTLERNDNGKRK